MRHLIEALASILDLALNIYMWLIIARALLSWVNPDPYNPIVRFLYNVTEPVLGWVRRRVPLIFGGLDLSPLLILLAIVFLRRFLILTLLDLAQRIG
jgi:YggT family protein